MYHSPSIVPQDTAGLAEWLLHEAEQHERAAHEAAEPFGARLSAQTADNFRHAASIVRAYGRLPQSQRRSIAA